MPKYEKAIHLDAFKLYIQFGMMSKEFLREFEKQTGKSGKTAYAWEKDFDWKARAKEPINEAIQELEEEEKLNAKELVAGFLDLCKNRMDGSATHKSYIEAIFGTSFERIPSEKNPKPKNALEVKTLQDMESLVRMHSMIERGEQAWVKIGLLLAGEPDSRSEHTINLAQAIMDGTYYKES